MLKINSQAPDFSALDKDGRLHRLSDYRGKWVLLYFYPKDDTPGCTAEACALRDSFPDFRSIRAEILGVSGDSEKSHSKFSQKYNLPFTLLSDPGKSIAKAYGAVGLRRRISYLIGPDGIIVQTYDKVRPAEHAGEVLHDLSLLTNQ